MMAYIPAPDTIPVAWGYFQALLLATFPLHLFFMNAMVGSAAVGIFLHFKKGEHHEEMAELISKFLPLTIAFAVNFGVAPLLFLQVLYGHFVYVTSILMGAFWLSLVAILIFAYYSSYIYDFKFKALGSKAVWFLVLAFVLFLIVGLFFSNNMTMMLTPETWTRYFDNMSGTILNFVDPTLIPRYLHFMIGAIAVGGLYVALLGKLTGKLTEPLLLVGMKTFFIFTIIQIVIGVWFLISLPKDTMMVFMGRNLPATIMFVLALLLVVVLLYLGYKKCVYKSAIVVAVLIYLMVFMRDYVRTSFIGKVFDVSSLKVVPEYSPFVFFLVVFVPGIYVVYWLLKKAKEAFTS